MGADIVLHYRERDVLAEVKKLTGGGADVAIEALGTQGTFEGALRSLRRGALCRVLEYIQASCRFRMTRSRRASGITGSLPLCARAQGAMRRLMEIVRHGRVDLTRF